MRAKRCAHVPLPPDIAHMVIDSDMLAVRDGLHYLLSSELMSGLTKDSLSTAEVVLAEVLNNIVEHAYALFPGKIAVSLSFRDDRLQCDISDAGLPMPAAGPPAGILHETLEGTDLPEGGFGWFLIRSLSRDLSYRRQGSTNLLSFSLSANDPPEIA